ncbi:MAG: DUF92 domain-containing protein [Candidatus Micrarchaeota archaeon]|nr:DUF92 domain-containing protein [Candidatus Micrarchaeota archaeon]
MLKKALLLDEKALVATIITGLALIYYGYLHGLGLNYLLVTLAFLVFSVIVTKIGKEEKKAMGLYEHMRGFENVVANGIVPIICLVLGYKNGFVGSIAGITADKFASELGVFGEDPVYLGSFKRVKKGTNGAVSLYGLIMSFLGGLLIGFVWVFLTGQGAYDPKLILIIGITGFFGSMGDSLAGILEEKGIGNKYTSNIIGAIFGAVFGELLM